MEKCLELCCLLPEPLAIHTWLLSILRVIFLMKPQLPYFNCYLAPPKYFNSPYLVLIFLLPSSISNY